MLNGSSSFYQIDGVKRKINWIFFLFLARLLSIKDINPADYINELDNFLLDVSVLAFLATLWVSFVFVISR